MDKSSESSPACFGGHQRSEAAHNCPACPWERACSNKTKRETEASMSRPVPGMAMVTRVPTPPHPILCFANAGEMVVVVGETTHRRPMTAFQLFNIAKSFADAAFAMQMREE